jgi:predicted metal-dependent phosphoesterase TrpH
VTRPDDAAPVFDLQGHSTHSDGALPAAEVVRRAAEAGVEVFALTDHDTVDGVDEALATAADCGIRLIPAVEISAVRGSFEDLHVLGYDIDHRDAALVGALERFRSDREARAARMGERLAELGYAVDDSVIEARRRAGKPVGRPHLAAAAVGHPANRERLEREGLTEMTDFLVAYLIPGRPAFVSRTTPTVEEAIELIHGAGGVAVWAHPFWDCDDPQVVTEALDDFAASGLDGVEAFYVAHDEAQTRLLVDRARTLGIATTGSADYHGPDHKRFSAFRAFALHGLQPVLPAFAAA